MRGQATLDSLPSELIHRILWYLAERQEASSNVDLEPPESIFPPSPANPLGLAQYATISKKWKMHVEALTFHTVKTTSDNLVRLMNCMEDLNRWMHYRNLFYTIHLPSYSLNRRSNFERRREHQANLERFRHQVWALFNALGGFHEGHSKPRELRLSITAESPVDRVDDPRDQPDSDLADLRWSHPEHSLTLSAENEDFRTLDRIINVKSLSIAKTGRRIHPSAISEMLYVLPTLRKLEIRIPAVKARHKDLRAEMRNSLANTLTSGTLSNLEILSLEMEDSTPCNHNFSIASSLDDDFPAGDHLSRAVCGLAQRSLKELYMGPEVLISSVLWGVDPLHPDREQKNFPALRKVQIEFGLVTYDGRWYYTGDPENSDVASIDLEAPPPDSDEDESDSDSCSSYNSEYSDHINEDRGAYLDGNKPWYDWRRETRSSHVQPANQKSGIRCAAYAAARSA